MDEVNNSSHSVRLYLLFIYNVVSVEVVKVVTNINIDGTNIKLIIVVHFCFTLL
jgi:hypothetical protein